MYRRFEFYRVNLEVEHKDSNHLKSFNLCFNCTTEGITYNGVTKQSGAHAGGALVHAAAISVDGNRFLFTGFQPLGC